MKRINKHLVPTILLIAALLTMTAVQSFATTHQVNNSLVSAENKIVSKVVSQATAWFEDNYGKFYDLRNVDADIVRVFENDSVIRYTVAMSCETLLKYDNVADLPFVKGLNSTLTSRSVKTNEKTAIDAFINEIDANIGEYRDLTVDLVIAIDKNDTTAPWTMYYQDAMETTLHSIDAIALDAQEMYIAGRNAASDIVSAYGASAGRGYSSYNRINARDYALNWVSSSTISSCYDCGTSCGVLQNRTKWNNTVYPYFSNFMHTDCADFVSQAMSAGGLPESGTWFRTKNVSTQSWGAAWTAVASLKAFMTDNSHKYWDSSTYAACNAGNIVLTSSSHVAMITLNDTVTHRLTSHTNDRRDCSFADSNGYLYYTIKTT